MEPLACTPPIILWQPEPFAQAIEALVGLDLAANILLLDVEVREVTLALLGNVR